jgi:menaquinol-cytochrome c reductase iron-sulfur subunit
MREKMSRRTFLAWLARASVGAAAVAASAQVARFLAFEPPSTEQTILPLGSPDAYPRDSLTYVAEARVYVVHEAGGLYAVDAVCPHLGCLVEPGKEGGFVCPCHDSRFDGEGRVQNGPATKGLRFLHLWLEGAPGQLLVDRTKAVDAAARLPL